MTLVFSVSVRAACALHSAMPERLYAPKPLQHGALPYGITHPTCFKRKRRLRQRQSNRSPILSR